jgi:ATP-dependent DNA helicase RecQ
MVARDPLDVLRTVWGYPAFRGLQEEVIRHVLAGGDALVLMPTGGGKSLCYQVPALCLDGLTVVISPLIALMQDQVTALAQLGVRAAMLNSTLDFRAATSVERAMREGQLDLIYVAPERLKAPGFLDLLARCRLALFAIDEAHCVSQWGHDFRPDYLELRVLHERFPAVPRLALTATADAPTRREIVERLDLGQGRQFVAGFDRPNIRYRVVPKLQPKAQLLAYLRDQGGASGIVYCLSRRKVEDTAAALVAAGIEALPYHAGLDKDVRAANQDRFIKEEGVVMVATIAFGMGIDKPDVRFVLHLDLPKSLEAYYQETGRAGRDGLPAEAWMLYGLDDVGKLKGLLARAETTSERQRHVDRQKLEAMLGYCETTRCRRQVLLGYFGEELPEPCGNCDVCLDRPDSFDGTELAQKALSAIYRTGQRFGAGHVIDVLRGEGSERMRRLSHDELSVFGIGRELEPTGWRSVLRQLAAQGLIEIDVEGHGGMALAGDCRAVLRGERRIELRRDPAARRSTAKTRSAARLATLPDSESEGLFQRLREWRLRTARAQGVPPYVIFHDATLLAIAAARPRSRRDLEGLPGLGAAKLERYGDALLAFLAD